MASNVSLLPCCAGVGEAETATAGADGGEQPGTGDGSPTPVWGLGFRAELGASKPAGDLRQLRLRACCLDLRLDGGCSMLLLGADGFWKRCWMLC